MYSKTIKLVIDGGSHEPYIDTRITGIPIGTVIDANYIQSMLERRKSGKYGYSTPRREQDVPELIEGVCDGVVTHDSILARVFNANIKPKDYSGYLNTPRPSHADYVARIKFKDEYAKTGGGEFSGRMTIGMVIAGAIAKQALEQLGISVEAGISQIGGIECGDYDKIDKSVIGNQLPIIDISKIEPIKELLDKSVSKGDSLGGCVSCCVKGMPVGIGNAMFQGLESYLSANIFGIPAVKGVEFGTGFSLSKMNGSLANDAFRIKDGKVVTATNNNGGINGGISNGMDITMRVAFKPTPSISSVQNTVNLDKMENVTIAIKGRHDASILPRAVVVVEAIVALTIFDQIISN